MQTRRLFPFVLSASAALALCACGGGGSSTSEPASPVLTLQGLAATGAALSNAAVTAKCATGPALAGTTAADGSFTLSLAGGQTVPCMVQVIGGVPTITLHSFATEAGRVNVTPLTDITLAKALGGDPGLAFASYSSAKGDAIKLGLDGAKTYANAQLATIAGQASAVDIMTGVFKVGDATDKLLDALTAAVTAAGKVFADLRVGAAQGVALKPLIPALPPVGTSPTSPITPTTPTTLATPTTPTTPATPTTPTTPTAPSTPSGAGYECAPLLAKAGDSLTYQYSTSPTNLSYDLKQDYSSTTYQGQSALAMTVTTVVNGVSTSGVTYYNPLTGAYLGDTGAPANTTTVTTYDPPDFQDRINNTVMTIGQVTNVTVKARVTGKGITDAFAAIGGGTALTMDYSYTIERKPNETLTVPAGSFTNTCKLQINATPSNLKLEGNAGTNALFATLFPSISGAFSIPIKSTVWLSNKLPQIPKTFVDSSSSFGSASATQELKAYTLAPR